MCRVGSIEPDGIRYGLTTNAWVRKARPTATATVTISSITEYSGDFCFLDVRDAISASLGQCSVPAFTLTFEARLAAPGCVLDPRCARGTPSGLRPCLASTSR